MKHMTWEERVARADAERAEMLGDVDILNAAPPSSITITSKSGIMGGKLCFDGTRIPIYIIFSQLAAGDTIDQILGEYPDLTPDHLKAAFEYVAAKLRRRLK